MPGLYDRIRDTWTISSPTTLAVSSTFTVTGTAASGFQTFAARYATNEGNIPVAIVSQTANQWMICWCTYNPTGSTPNLLRIDTVIFSTSGDSSVTFSPATMDVFVTASSRAVPGLRESNTFTASQVISVNSATDALRVTQTGAGNAILVEDSANPDATPFVVDVNGRVASGSTIPYPSVFATVPQLAVAGNATVFGLMGLSQWSADTFGNRVDFAKSKGTTAGTHALVSNGDELGIINFAGSDGTSFIRGAVISASVDGTPGTNDMPGRLVFLTTLDGASTPTERMRIDNSGNVGIGTPAPATRLHVQETNQFSLGFTARTSSAQTAILNHPVALLENSDVSAGNGLNVRFRIADTSGALQVAGGIGAIAESKTASSVSGGLYLYTGSTEKMRIDNAGNVGIGMTAPVARLSVTVASGGAATNNLFLSNPVNQIGTEARLLFGPNINLVGQDRQAWIGGINQDGTNATALRFATNPAGSGAAERMRIDAAGNIGIGTTVPGTVTGTTGANLVLFNSASTTPIVIARNQTNDANGSRWFWDKERAGAIVSNGDTLGQFFFRGYDGANFQSAAAITAQVDGVPGTNDMPGRLIFSTTADGASSAAERMRIDNAGNVGIGGVSSPRSILHTYSATTYQPQIISDHASATAGSAGYLVLDRSRGSISSRAAITNGDTIGTLMCRGYDGASFSNSAWIECVVDNTVSTNAVPSAIRFFTTTSSGTSGERARITSGGLVGINVTPTAPTRFRVDVGPQTASGPGVQFVKSRDATNAIRYEFVDCGGTPSDANGQAFWRGIHIASVLGGITDPVNGTTIVYPALSQFFEYNSLSSPSSRRFIFELKNDSSTTTHSFVFRSESTDRLLISPTGLVGINTSSPNARLEVQTGSISFGVGATALSSTLRVMGGTLATAINSEVVASSTGCSTGNNSALGVRFFRHTDLGTDWQSSSICLSMDVDTTARAGASIWLGHNKNVGIGPTNTIPAVRFHVQQDGTDEVARFEVTTAHNPYVSLYRQNIRQGYWYSNGGTGFVEFAAESSKGLRFSTIGAQDITFFTGNVEKARITSGVQFLVGHSASVESITGVATAKLQVSGTDGTSAAAVYRYSADADGPMFILSKSRGGIGVSAAVSAGDELGAIHFAGAGSSGFHRGASIRAIADTGATGAADMPGRLQFLTSADGSATPTERLRITSTGDVVLMNDAGARDVSSLGFRGIPSNEQSANYTLALTDAGKAVVKMITTAMTVTVPDNVTAPFPIGTTIMIDNSHPTAYSTTANIVTITPAADVGIVGAGAVKDLTTGTLPRFKNKTMNWPMQASLRKIRNKGSAVTLTTNPSASTTTVTITMPSTNPYRPNDFIIIAGGTNTAYNGTHRVLTVSGLTLTYQLAAAPSGATGTYTATPADLWVITGDYGNSTTA